MNPDVQSISRTYITLLSISIAYLIICHYEIKNDQIRSQIDKYLAIDTIFSVALMSDAAGVPAKRSDIQRFSPYAFKIAAEMWGLAKDPEQEGQKAKVLEDATIEGSVIFESVPSRTAGQFECDVLRVRLVKGGRFIIPALSLIDSSLAVASEQTAFIEASNCTPIRSPRLSAIVVLKDTNEVVVGFPEPYLGALSIFSYFRQFGKFWGQVQENQFGLYIPAELNSFFDLKDTYIFISESEFNAHVRDFVSSALGANYKHTDRESALEDLAEFQPTDASFAGVTAQNSDILKFGVLLIFATSYILWRKLSLFNQVQRLESPYWVPFDAVGPLSLLGAMFYGLLPIILYFFVSSCYLKLHKIYIKIYDLSLYFDSNVGLQILNEENLYNLYYSPDFDSFESVIVIIMMVIYLILSGLASKKLISISWRRFNLRES